jgi:hypothetical protein
MQPCLLPRRALVVAALAIPMLLALPGSPASASGRVNDWVCDYRWRAGTHQVRQLIRCAAERWPVPGGPAKALSVARCESGFDPRAYASGNAGVYQQRVAYWAGRASQWGFPGASVYNGRANIIVSVRMAHASGWDAWACG